MGGSLYNGIVVLGAGAGYLGKDEIKDLLGGEDKPRNPLQTLEGAKEIAQKETFDQMAKDLYESHPAIPADAQLVNAPLPNQFSSTDAWLNDVTTPNFGDTILPGESQEEDDTPIRYTPNRDDDLIARAVRTVTK